MGNFGQTSQWGEDGFTKILAGFSKGCASFWRSVPILSSFYPANWSEKTSTFGSKDESSLGEWMKKAAIWLLIAILFGWALEWLLNWQNLDLGISEFGIFLLTKGIYLSMIVPVAFQILRRFKGDSRFILLTLFSPIVLIGALVMILLAGTGSLTKKASAENFKGSSGSREDFTNPSGTFSNSGDMVTQSRPTHSNTFTSSATPDFSKLEKKKSLWDLIFGFSPDKRFKR